MTIELQKANRFNECMLYYITKKRLEAAGGVEPPNNGFANRRLRPLGYAALIAFRGVYAARHHCGGVVRAFFTQVFPVRQSPQRTNLKTGR